MNKKETGQTTGGKEETVTKEKTAHPASDNYPENEINEKLNRCLEAVQKMEETYISTIQELNEKLQQLEENVSNYVEKDKSTGETGPQESQIINELLTKICNIQTDMDKLNKTTYKILEEKKNSDTQTNVCHDFLNIFCLLMIKFSGLAGANRTPENCKSG